ncbi:MAG: hypothetical protein WCB12_01325 [Bryobacteraceae bacterium]
MIRHDGLSQLIENRFNRLGAYWAIRCELGANGQRAPRTVADKTFQAFFSGLAVVRFAGAGDRPASREAFKSHRIASARLEVESDL